MVTLMMRVGNPIYIWKLLFANLTVLDKLSSNNRIFVLMLVFVWLRIIIIFVELDIAH